MLPAITVDGIIYSHIKTGGYDGDNFIQYIEGLLTVMNPYPGPQSVLIIDNCQTHHVDSIKEMCAAQYACILCSHLVADVIPVASSWFIYLHTHLTSTPSKNVFHL
jgi:hypothetical protein